MRDVIRHHADIGVDQIKLSMSGEEVKSLSVIQFLIADAWIDSGCPSR
jgi:hypothetical protein